MSQTNFTPILLYASNTATSVPSAGNLTNSANGAELAVNTADKRLFTKDGGGSVVELGTNPSSLSLPNQTANGVLYLDGSKVATSGSGLVYDGTILRVNGSVSSGLRLASNSGASNGFNIYNDSSTDIAYLMNFYNGSMVFGVNNSEQMRLTSTGLGIGTSSPGQRLEIQAPAGASQNATIRLRATDSGSSAGCVADIAAVGTGGQLSALAFSTRDGTNIVERMRLDASGNLGIGTSSPASKLDVNGAISISGIEAIRNRVFAYSGSYSATQVGSPSSNNGNVALAVDVNSVAGGGFSGSNQVILPNNGALFVNAAGSDFIGAIRRDSSNRILIGPNTSSGLTSGDLVIDSSGNLGLGVAPSAWRSGDRALDIGSTASLVDAQSANTRLYNNTFVATGGTNTYKITAAASYYDQGGGVHRWFNAASGTAGNAISFTQAMTLDASGNLGIGTSSPGAKLHVTQSSGSAIFGTTAGGTGYGGSFENTDGGTTKFFRAAGAGANGVFSAGVGATTQLFLDTSGNLGLGVTPSAWATNIKALQIKAGGLTGALSVTDSGAYIVSLNEYLSGGLNLYTANGFASRYYQFNGQHVWLTAPSGTAGNAISFTQAMTLDASGNLGVGETSPGTKLTVRALSPTIRLTDSNTAVSGGVFGTIDWLSADSSMPGGLAAKIDALDDATVGDRAALRFFTNNGTSLGERARITSGGAFLVAQTAVTTSENLGVTYTGNNDGVYVYNVSASPTGTGVTVNLGNSTGTNVNTAFLYKGRTAGGDRFLVYGNGGIANYSANDVNLSDRREKTNFAPAKSYLDTICAIPVQTFEYIDQSEDDPGLTLGVVAQDVQAVAPELVMESNWGTADEPKMRLSIYQTDLQYALMKCIQELKAQNDELRARVAALESQP